MLKKIRIKLLLSYLFLSLNLIMLAGVAFYYARRAEELRNSQSKILEADLKLQKLINTDLLIINRETVKNDFFKNRKSPLLTEHHLLVNEIQAMMFDFKEIVTNSYEVENDTVLGQIEGTLVKYNENFNEYLHMVFVRGFRDYGLEGQMRDKAHVLEQMKIISIEELLYLRRHEKDFFLRKDTIYVTKFNQLCDELIKKNRNNAHFLHEQETLESYCSLFNEIAKIDEDLGLTEDQGYRLKLHAYVIRLESLFANLFQSSREITQQKLKRGEWLFYISIAISLALSVLLSLYFSNFISKPVKQLALSMDDLVVNEELFPFLPYNQHYDTEEIQMLWQSFYKMSVAIKKQFEEIKEKSDLLEQQNYRLNKLNNELDQFIYSASHDLKAPLSSLLGLISILRKRVEPNIHDEYFELMEGSIKRLEKHIKEIIQYSKNHQLDISIHEIKLKDTIELNINQLKFQIGTEEIEIRMDVIEKVSFFSDPMRLNMILFNIISNAFKYYDNTKPKKSISINVFVNTKMATISVEDNGVGIEHKYLERIFELFFRANEKSTGSGLGLFIAKEAIDKLQGTIKVKSEPGRGTLFTVTIPNHFSGVL
jgi:signal transduction histidine kinase